VCVCVRVCVYSHDVGALAGLLQNLPTQLACDEDAYQAVNGRY
jgi:hypothetical protein